MDDRLTVGYCADLVRELESFSASEWRRLFSQPYFEAFMDRYLTAKCLTDFWWHVRWGVYFKAWKHYSNDLHGDVCNWLQTWTRERHGLVEPVTRKAIVMSRELCKTQLLIAWDGWQFARDPNNRLLIRAYDATKAEEIGSAVGKLLRSKKYRARYPWVRPAVREGTTQLEKWRGDQLMLQRDDEDVKVPSMEAMGIKGQPTGGHFQVGHYDDFEVDANANSDVELELLFETYRNDINLFEAGAQSVLAGTPWSMRALIYGILYRKNGMEDHDIDVFMQPCCNRVFDRPFEGHEPVLLEDRVTLCESAAGFPTQEANLATCQATVRFFNEQLGGVIEEVREVVWNDGNHFRVNRPFPEVFGQPLHYVIGVDKPACPVRQTLDAIDWIPEIGGELPEEVSRHASEPGVDGVLNSRFSLPKKRQASGSRIFALQQELKGIDDTALVLNSGDLQFVTWDQVPTGSRRWRRAGDFASSKRTAAATSMTTGFEMAHGFYVPYICYEPQMGTSWKLLEMVVGVKRVEAWGGRLEYTTFEKSGHIEEVVGELLPDVCRDPHAYFTRLGQARPAAGHPTYAEYAARWFTPGQPVSCPIRWIGRTQSKNDRMATQQPVWESKKLYIITECPHQQTLIDCADRFTMSSQESLDLLDNLADLLSQGRLLKPEVAAARDGAGRNDWDRVLSGAGNRMREALAHGVNPGWGEN